MTSHTPPPREWPTPEVLLAALRRVETIVSDDFCCDLEMQCHTGDRVPRLTPDEVRTAERKLGAIYRIVHSLDPAHSCHHVHGDWRAEFQQLPAPAVDPTVPTLCMFCGKTFAEHDYPRPPGSPVPKVPCLMLKSGFTCATPPPPREQPGPNHHCQSCGGPCRYVGSAAPLRPANHAPPPEPPATEPGWLIEGLRDAQREADANPELRKRVDEHPSGFLPKPIAEPGADGVRDEELGEQTAAGPMTRTIRDLVRACDVCIGEEQEKLLPQNHVIAVLCDSIRMAREYVQYVKASIRDNGHMLDVWCAARGLSKAFDSPEPVDLIAKARQVYDAFTRRRCQTPN